MAGTAPKSVWDYHWWSLPQFKSLQLQTFVAAKSIFAYLRKHIRGCKRALCSDNFTFVASVNKRQFCIDKNNFTAAKPSLISAAAKTRSKSCKSDIWRQNLNSYLFTAADTCRKTERQFRRCMVDFFAAKLPHVFLRP